MRPSDYLTITGNEAGALGLHLRGVIRIVRDGSGLWWALHHPSGVRWRWWR